MREGANHTTEGCLLRVCSCPQVGGEKTFDPSVYSHNLVLNRQQQADSLQRSYVGSGDILAFHPGGGGCATPE